MLTYCQKPENNNQVPSTHQRSKVTTPTSRGLPSPPPPKNTIHPSPFQRSPPPPPPHSPPPTPHQSKNQSVLATNSCSTKPLTTSRFFLHAKQGHTFSISIATAASVQPRLAGACNAILTSQMCANENNNAQDHLAWTRNISGSCTTHVCIGSRVCYSRTKKLCVQREKTRRANAQMIHIHHTYRTSSQSSPLHKQLSQTSELLHATLQQNNCTISSFLLTLWPWVNIKVIQTGINTRVDMFSIIPIMTQIASQVSWHRAMLMHIF